MLKKSDLLLRLEDRKTDTTVIAQGAKIEGSLISSGSVFIQGAYQGSLQIAQNLQVGGKAKILATVIAANAKIAGAAQGNFKIYGQLELLQSALITGDVEAKTLVVAAGAYLNGKCRVGIFASSENSLPAAQFITPSLRVYQNEKATS